jgi:hypothetical protein
MHLKQADLLNLVTLWQQASKILINTQMPSATYVAKNAVVILKREIIAPLLQKNKELELTLQRQYETTERLKQQVAALEAKFEAYAVARNI